MFLRYSREKGITELLNGWMSWGRLDDLLTWLARSRLRKGLKMAFPTVTPVSHIKIFKARNVKPLFFCHIFVLLCNNKFINIDFYGAALSSGLLL